MTAWKVYGTRLAPLEVERLTERFAFHSPTPFDPHPRREKLRTGYSAIFVNKPDAETYLRARLERRIATIEENLAVARRTLEALNS